MISGATITTQSITFFASEAAAAALAAANGGEENGFFVVAAVGRPGKFTIAVRDTDDGFHLGFI